MTVAQFLDWLEAQGADVSAARAAMNLAKVAGVPVRWVGRFKSTAGQCVMRRLAGSGTLVAVELKLNPRLKVEGLEALRETFLHELAHALTPGHRHDLTWRLTFKAIGGKGRRTHSYASMPTRPARVVATCDACGYQVKRRKAFPRGRTYTHTRCGGHLRRVGE